MKPKKIVVFDLDETLGHFGQLSMLWFNLTGRNKCKINRTRLLSSDGSLPRSIAALIF